MPVWKIILFVFLGLLALSLFWGLITLYFVKAIMSPKAPTLKPGKKYVACVGDSITFGAGVIANRQKDSYPAILGSLLGDSFQVLNYGFSSRTLLANGDFPYTKENLFKESLKANADYYILMLGTNDSKPQNWNKENYEKELDAFVKQYLELPNHPKVIMLQPSKCFPDKTGKVAFKIQNDIIENDISAIVERVGRQNNVAAVLDLYALTEDHPEYFADGVHPNKLGNTEIAKLIYYYIK